MTGDLHLLDRCERSAVLPWARKMFWLARGAAFLRETSPGRLEMLDFQTAESGMKR
jgi:hypothetical protein